MIRKNGERFRKYNRQLGEFVPLGVTILLDIVFALSEGVPEFDCSVTRTGNDLSVISTEADGQDIGSVSHESAGGNTGVEVPKTEGVVPG